MLKSENILFQEKDITFVRAIEVKGSRVLSSVHAERGRCEDLFLTGRKLKAEFICKIAWNYT
jgi:hypothetical protein